MSDPVELELIRTGGMVLTVLGVAYFNYLSMRDVAARIVRDLKEKLKDQPGSSRQ